MPFFNNDNTKLYFEVHGNGLPLLIIPGGGADGRYYSGLVEILKDHFQIILPDPRGCGRSEKGNQTYSFDLLASDMAALINHLSIDSLNIMGHSMGGMVAQHMAYEYPSLIKKLILFATASTLSAFGKHCCKTAVLAKTEASLRTFIHVMSIWNFSNSFFSDESNIDNMIKSTEEDPYPLQATSLIEQMNIISHFDCTTRLNEIHSPTFVIGCAEDIIFPSKNVKKLSVGIPNARYHEIENAPHSIHIEQPKLVAKIIEEFLLI